MTINQIKLAISPLTGKPMLYRHGKDERLALEKREAEADVLALLWKWTDEGASVIEFSLDGKAYELQIVSTAPPPPAPAGEVAPVGWIPPHDDLCRLSRVFGEAADLGNSQDYRINEWLKEQIEFASGKANER